MAFIQFEAQRPGEDYFERVTYAYERALALPSSVLHPTTRKAFFKLYLSFAQDNAPSVDLAEKIERRLRKAFPLPSRAQRAAASSAASSTQSAYVSYAVPRKRKTDEDDQAQWKKPHNRDGRWTSSSVNSYRHTSHTAGYGRGSSAYTSYAARQAPYQMGYASYASGSYPYASYPTAAAATPAYGSGAEAAAAAAAAQYASSYAAYAQQYTPAASEAQAQAATIPPASAAGYDASSYVAQQYPQPQ